MEKEKNILKEIKIWRWIFKWKKWNGNIYNHNDNIIYKLDNGKNNIVKEYDYIIGTLVFEGEYLNGKRNGKGKEYNYIGKIEFEGEYLNGNRLDGKKKLYEIQYLNGIKI